MPYHIRAERVPEGVLITGDPLRADRFTSLLERPRLINDNRGLRTYVGFYKDKEVAIAAHGMGGPSAAIVVEELISIGAKKIIRVGTAGAISPELRPGDVLVADAASSTYGGAGLGLYFGPICPPSSPDPELTYRLLQELSKLGVKVAKGPVFSSDSFYAESNVLGLLKSLGFKAVEMECATVTALSRIRGVSAACALVISNSAGSLQSDQTLVDKGLTSAATASLEVLIR
ncbi:purine-nucleoside phosphorylase [Acidilobus sp.]|jgi:5'-methylthioadenosine phosphorylase|uniref:purine-nucleoside phosphorylase n=1 Tax=Acidilobus sp. TaxID=1872109 RepID=UPI003CFE61E7